VQTTPMISPQAQMPAGPDSVQQRRELAIKRIKEKNAFKVHLVAYLVVNAMLVVIWATTGAGYFWPIFVMAAWGVGVVINGYTAYRGDAITEEQIEREMKTLP
jgi:2TM domain